MNQTLIQAGLVAFAEVHVVPSFEKGILGIAQANGFAGLQSNTVMFGWADQLSGLCLQLRVMRNLARLNLSTILAKLPNAEGPAGYSTIDVWWGGLQNNGDLMLLLAHLLQRNPQWRRARIAVRTIVRQKKEREQMHQKISELVHEARIQAETDVIFKSAEQSLQEIMHKASRNTDVVFFGLNIPQPGDEEHYAQQLVNLASGFSSVIFVRNSGQFSGELL